MNEKSTNFKSDSRSTKIIFLLLCCNLLKGVLCYRPKNVGPDLRIYISRGLFIYLKQKKRKRRIRLKNWNECNNMTSLLILYACTVLTSKPSFTWRWIRFNFKIRLKVVTNMFQIKFYTQALKLHGDTFRSILKIDLKSENRNGINRDI